MTRRFNRIHALTALLLMATLTIAGCHKKPANPFPETGKVADWTKSSETRTFDAANLWQYIDGDSEQYIQAGVVTTSTSDYKYKGSLEATVDVYTMTNANGAKTIFEADPQGSAVSAPVGDAARVSPQSVVFRKGPYLVRIVAFDARPGTSDALLALAHSIDGRL
ncbi:MAG: hypothetical protein P4L10_12840 [Acidobacteriaceae bacterium]|nr:hypothetical protein [Acidobacteriaceae bacterium]